jgi:hypothetical protein
MQSFPIPMVIIVHVVYVSKTIFLIGCRNVATHQNRCSACISISTSCKWCPFPQDGGPSVCMPYVNPVDLIALLSAHHACVFCRLVNRRRAEAALDRYSIAPFCPHHRLRSLHSRLPMRMSALPLIVIIIITIFWSLWCLWRCTPDPPQLSYKIKP